MLDPARATVLAHRRVQLALSALARLFVMTMLSEIGEDARLLALLLEALERALEVLVVMDYDFRQNLLPPFVAFAAPAIGIDSQFRGSGTQSATGMLNSEC